MEEIGRFETKIKNINELIIDTIEHDYSKLIVNLNLRKGFKIELEKIKIFKTVVGTIKIIFHCYFHYNNLLYSILFLFFFYNKLFHSFLYIMKKS